MTARRRWLRGATVLIGVSVALVVGFAVLRPANGSGGHPAVDHAAAASGNGDSATPVTGGTLAQSIAQMQAHLRAVPGDWPSWASLGAAYVQQARLTADPTYYPKADGAFTRSLELYPRGNSLALTGQATLAAARHDFAGALRLANAALSIDAYSATAYGIKGDALVELGRYPEAAGAFSRMDNLRPGLDSFSRLSYLAELHGDSSTATRDLQLALQAADTPADAGFALYYLGELAWNAGNLTAAAQNYDQGLRRDPSYLPLLEGRAKVEAARGQQAAALRDFQELVDRLPQPLYVIEYGDYLSSLHRVPDAQAQYALVRTEEQLFRAQGVNVDLELALFDADHGSVKMALHEAAAELQRRQSILVEDAYAWALHMTGHNDSALVYIDRALALGMRNASMYFHRGAIEAALGRPAQAINDLRTALAINPHFSFLSAPRAADLLRHLTGLTGASTP
jgi:tetratricopeptide (TPR) repeat protein